MASLRVKAYSQKVLKDLMLGLIYPAVLGNIIYLSIDQVRRQMELLFTALLGGTLSKSDPILAMKFGFLIVTLAFYFSDYLYIYFTREFQKRFFVYDLIFVMFLLFTVVYINIDKGNKLPNLYVIVFGYLIFMWLYRLWDKFELKKCRKENCWKPEIKLYERIILWEKLSLFGLGGCAVLILIFGIQYWTSGLLLLVLALTTFSFWKYTLLKSRLYKLQESRKASMLDRISNPIYVDPSKPPSNNSFNPTPR